MPFNIFKHRFFLFSLQILQMQNGITIFDFGLGICRKVINELSVTNNALHKTKKSLQNTS